MKNEIEHQNVEFKESWHDKYLEWICGYANASGGVLYIGRDDNGAAVGVEDAKGLLELIPSKITNTMGIVADVNLRNENGKDVIAIAVDKYPFPISYYGRYYYRSGSTMRLITGKELDRLLLKQYGKTWDGMVVPKLSVAQLDGAALSYFRKKAVDNERLTREDIEVSDAVLMENLKIADEDGGLYRAAMLAFAPDPEKWVTGAYIKIGCFGDSDSDLLYQDEVHGPLLLQVDKTADLVYTKYLKAHISYDGMQRKEKFIFPREAFREVLLNAIVHKDYSSCHPIQISVYADKIYVWNAGVFPASLNTKEKLFAKHSSKPFNPKLAFVFFKCGLIEAWGRGMDKISKACAKSRTPDYDISDDEVMVLCHSVLPLRERILMYAEGRGWFKKSEIVDVADVDEKQIQRELVEMCEIGLLEYQGERRWRQYRIIPA